jgi:Mn2+/Fe2+ NRAMP family transporter
VISLLALALSVFVRWRIAAAGLIFAVFLLLPGFAEVINVTLQTQWGRVLNLSYEIRVIWAQLFRLEPRFIGVREQMLNSLGLHARLPILAAWFSILTTCLISLFLINRKLKAREVVRG